MQIARRQGDRSGRGTRWMSLTMSRSTIAPQRHYECVTGISASDVFLDRGCGECSSLEAECSGERPAVAV